MSTSSSETDGARPGCCQVGPETVPLVLGGMLLIVAGAAWMAGDRWGGFAAAMIHLLPPVAVVLIVAGLLVRWLFARLCARSASVEAPIRQLSRGMLWCFGVLLLAALVTEVSERTWKDSLPRRRFLNPTFDVGEARVVMIDEELGWRGSPHRPKRGAQLGPGRNNSEGFADIERRLDDERPTVLVIGDSFARAWPVPFEASLTGVLRLEFPEYQLVNQSCQSYFLDQMVLAYGRFGRPLKPEVVVVATIAQPSHLESHPMRGARPKPWCVLRDGKLKWFLNPTTNLGPTAADRMRYVDQQVFLRVTSFGEAVDFLWPGWLQRRTGLGRGLRRWVGDTLPSQFPVNRVDPVSVALLQQLERDVKEDGARLIVVLAPHAGASKAPNPGWRMAPYVNALRDANLDVIDLAYAMTQHEESLYGTGSNAHPNAAGHRVSAEAVGARLRGTVSPWEKDADSR